MLGIIDKILKDIGLEKVQPEDNVLEFHLKSAEEIKKLIVSKYLQ
ncbi:hypothetical protein RDV78_05185 [Bacillota bacterium LX-D]|nr:hypothetical protein [Bacillota bacterium LX-D]